MFYRPNGLRNDVASFVEALKPSFLRFPGGNNLYDSPAHGDKRIGN